MKLPASRGTLDVYWKGRHFMEIPTRQDLLALTAEREGPHISLYMPAPVRGSEIQQSPIHLKNLVSQAEDGLVEAGMRRTLAKDLLAPVAELEGDTEFWQHQSGGLAIFVDEASVHQFRVPRALPDMALVQPRFHIKPLLPLLAEGVTFHVLAISSNQTRLLACTSASQSEVDLPGMPDSIDEVLWPDDVEKQNQFRSFYAGSSGQTAIVHGAGGTQPEPKDDLLRYFQEVDRVLAPYMRDHSGPLVLACVDYLAPIYREANAYAGLLVPNVGGSPDRVQDDDLRAAAWDIVRPGVEAAMEAATGRYRELAGTGQTTSQVSEAALAAVTGKIDTVFIALDRAIWGSIDMAAYRVEVHEAEQPGDVDLLDAIAANTLMAGGTVYAIEQEEAPEASGVAAIFRYAA